MPNDLLKAPHLNRQCLLDSYSMTECPTCGQILTRTSQDGEQLLCNLTNEGGSQMGLNILPILMEESYLKAYPEERKCRAFLEFCGEGDIEAIVDMLNDQREEDDDDDEEIAGQEKCSDTRIRSKDILRYQDQIGSMGSGLHVAVENQRTDVAWLLLLLASPFDISQTPDEVLRAADELGISREDQTGRIDIRSLRDSEGRTAEDRAASTGGIWNEWIQLGRLKEVT